MDLTFPPVLGGMGRNAPHQCPHPAACKPFGLHRAQLYTVAFPLSRFGEETELGQHPHFRFRRRLLLGIPNLVGYTQRSEVTIDRSTTGKADSTAALFVSATALFISTVALSLSTVALSVSTGCEADSTTAPIG